MEARGAYISIDQIVNSWLLKKEKTQHTYWKILVLAAEAVQELKLTSLPMLQHKLLTKAAGQPWFDLPEGFTEWVSVGIRVGDSWRPIGMSNRLMPVGSFASGGEFSVDEFGDDMDITGSQQSWNDGSGGRSASFNGTAFSAGSFATAAVPANTSVPTWLAQMYLGLGRTDTVVLNSAQNQIYCGSQFPSDELYLVYVGYDTVDTMTHIPVVAQGAIEAYIDWKYIKNKRNGLNDGKSEKQEYIAKHRELRARLNPITVTDMKQLLTQLWRGNRRLNNTTQTNPTGANGTTYNVFPQTTVGAEFDILATSDSAIISSTLLIGITVSRISYAGQTYNKDFFTHNPVTGSITLTTPGAEFYIGQRVTITSSVAGTTHIVAFTAPIITITPSTAGSTYTIPDAVEALYVGRNGFLDQSWTFASGTWTFSNPLLDGDVLTFGYNRVI